MDFVDMIKSPNIDHVILHRWPQPSVEGTLCISSHNILLSSRKDATEELWVLYRMIDSVERKLGLVCGTLTLKCKNFHIFQLEIPGVEACSNVADSIERLASLDQPQSLYPFFYRALFEIEENGWTMFPIEQQFSKLIPNHFMENWRITDINKDFKVCPTYPQYLIVPSSVDDDILRASANFRHLNRFPVLSYFHANTKAALLRCSQPLVGPNTRRCREDEKLLNAALGSGKKGFIVDTRAQNVAHIARSKGGGFEPEVYYPMWKRTHKSIEGNFALMESLTKLVEASIDTTQSMDKWLSRLESSNWLGHIKDVLTCACSVAQCLYMDGASVVVHGAEGLDTTLQVCSLVQVILDPACRTVKGFEGLIVREWLLAGHPFAARCQHGPFSSAPPRQQNPTFLLFLDCVYQIFQQFPCSFEFNEHFLIMLFEHAYASQFGTFLGNSERERKELNLTSNTVSLWSYINRPDILSTLLNPVYESNPKAIWPSVAPQSLELWHGLYLRWVCNLSQKEKAWEFIAEIIKKDHDLKERALKLRKVLAELEEAAVELGILSAPEEDLS